VRRQGAGIAQFSVPIRSNPTSNILAENAGQPNIDAGLNRSCGQAPQADHATDAMA
jgi:hypothetical protein